MIALMIGLALYAVVAWATRAGRGGPAVEGPARLGMRRKGVVA